MPSQVVTTADGDTLILRPGTYVHEDELVIDKSLSIQGDGTGEVVVVRSNQPNRTDKTKTSWFSPTRGMVCIQFG